MGLQRRPSLRIAAGTALVAFLLLPLTPRAAPVRAQPEGTRRPASGDRFDDIYRRGQPLAESLKTIRARFTETTTSRLLVKPLVAEGTVVVVRPSDILLTYVKPERRQVRLDATSLLLVWPDRQLRERRDIRQAQARVQKYFVDKSPAELRKHFTIRASDDRERPGTWHIEMIPTRKQIQQGLARLDLWIRQDTLVLVAMTMAFPNGDTKSMTFTDVIVNDPVSLAELTPSA